MKRTEIIVKTSKQSLGKIEKIARDLSPCGIYVEDYSNVLNDVSETTNVEIIDEDLLSKDPETCVVHAYPDYEGPLEEAIRLAKEKFDSAGVFYELESALIDEKDWADEWKKYFKPLNVGKNLLIRPVWETEYEKDGKIILNIDPGMAFGTGSHETTRACLEFIEKYVRKGDSILDVGCGSGILSVAALLFGARYALGVDLDPKAVEVARQNAELNGVSDKFEARRGNLVDTVTGKFDVAVANIVADAIIELSPSLIDYVTSSSIYIFGGIIDSRIGEVKSAVEKRFKIFDEKIDNGWFAAAARKK